MRSNQAVLAGQLRQMSRDHLKAQVAQVGPLRQTSRRRLKAQAALVGQQRQTSRRLQALVGQRCPTSLRRPLALAGPGAAGR